MKTNQNSLSNQKAGGCDYHNATGPVPIRMTNDYLFKVLLQKNEKVLRGLICSLLHLDPEEISEIDIRNPIIPGDSVSEKDIILDVNVIFNNEMIIDLEMQVVDEGNWTDRSLYYACRNYIHLEKGEDYEQTLPSIQVGILDFSLFKEQSDFYSIFKLMEASKHYLYTDKLQIRVLDLTKIHLATEEDRAYNIDEWARLFKAKTWEEIRMMAAKNQIIDEAANTIYQISEDERIRQQCEAREDYLRRQRGIQKILEQQKSQLEEARQQLKEKDHQLTEQKHQLTEQKQRLTEQKQRLTEQEQQLTAMKSELQEANKRLQELERQMLNRK